MKATKLKLFLIENNITQKELSLKTIEQDKVRTPSGEWRNVGISQANISLICKKNKDLNYSTVLRIKKALSSILNREINVEEIF
jgi:hypothetical protein